MNKKSLTAVIAIIIATSVGTGIGYQTFYELSNVDASIRDSNVHIDNSNVTLGENVTITNPPAGQPQPAEPENETQPAEQEETEELPYDFVVYEFTLKAEYINNTEWIRNYDSQKTWLENYRTYLESMLGYPEQTRDSLAAMMLAQKLYESSEINIETGRTKVTYRYEEHNGVMFLYSLEETYLLGKPHQPSITEPGWTKTLI